MAHLSGDFALIDAFRKGEDVHRTTGSVVFKVAPELVTNDMRRQAKVFNFGLMYGMGAFGLAQAAEIGQKEAGEFIAAYFAKFPKVAEFMESMKVSAREKGFVETELGRRRAVPEIRSENVQVARSGERMAINMPVQGLAADIMKLSMLAAEKLVKEYGEDVRMLLQVHDELIFEVRELVAEKFAKDLKQVMETAPTPAARTSSRVPAPQCARLQSSPSAKTSQRHHARYARRKPDHPEEAHAQRRRPRHARTQLVARHQPARDLHEGAAARPLARLRPAPERARGARDRRPARRGESKLPAIRKQVVVTPNDGNRCAVR
jgi:hypothetical protein